jgi:hypothetical protein
MTLAVATLQSARHRKPQDPLSQTENGAPFASLYFRGNYLSGSFSPCSCQRTLSHSVRATHQEANGELFYKSSLGRIVYTDAKSIGIEKKIF